MYVSLWGDSSFDPRFFFKTEGERQKQTEYFTSRRTEARETGETQRESTGGAHTKNCVVNSMVGAHAFDQDLNASCGYVVCNS